MTDHTILLDEHRGMASQKATILRRLRTDVEAVRAALQVRQDELERFLAGAPSTTWADAAEKARYLLSLFAETPAAQDPRRRRLIADLIADFDRLGSIPDASESDPVRTTDRSNQEEPHAGDRG